MISCIHANSKTYRSIDMTTVCPRLKAGNPCEYCYVQQFRKSGFRAKKEIDKIEYNGEILRMKENTIDTLNSMGGLRMFSFGDYVEWMDPFIEEIIEDAAVKNLKLKAITKQPRFANKYSGDININYSLDLLNDIPDSVWLLRELGVKLRCMVRNEKEAEEAAEKFDVLTPYHGKKLSDKYRPKEAMETALRYAPEKTCCKTGKCDTCDVKCGFGEHV